MMLFYHVTLPQSPISSWVGHIVKRKATGWVTLCFMQGIQWHFKAVNLEPVPRVRVPVFGGVAPDVLVNMGLNEACSLVLYGVVSPCSMLDGKIGVVVVARTPWPDWVMLLFNSIGCQCFKRKNLQWVMGACKVGAASYCVQLLKVLGYVRVASTNN